MSEAVLIAGPWVGEFGWELFAWQAYIRSLSEHYDKTIILCRQGSIPLYEDFADQFIESSPLLGLADSFFMHGVDPREILKSCLEEHRGLLAEGTTLVPPRRIGSPPFTPCTQPEQFGRNVITPRYIQFGTKANKICDYIFHIRSRELRKEDNWDLDNWRSLRDLLQTEGHTIACIGTKKEADHIEGTLDLRDEPLGDVFTVVRNAACVFGPSSGPMHLASLCGTAHVVWSKEGNRERYVNTWNPFQTPVLFLAEHSWHPSAEYVTHQFNQWRHNETV